ncbi:hypothetical protein [Paenibacillus sp. H1-7]|uniref:hypothetical protein n=1 Tax=Paenibacillus sp. H1-7 TaxID=2282849 RepID=UPI001EF9564F|nr:hypothetical protein [Paenibacillus sp. H1-7]
MNTQETTNDQITQLSYIMKCAVSMELRVENSNVKETIKMMDEIGFERKNQWASMHLKDCTVVSFWKKELDKP